jgi:outer membrane immunogenic protein
LGVAPVYKAPPPPAPVYNWTGCYVGGGGGYAFWQQDSFLTIGGTPITASQTNGGKGWFGQGQVGCDYQFTAPYFGVQTVIGAFGDFEGGGINGSSSFPGFTGSERESSTWSVGGRAGVLVTPRFLTYFRWRLHTGPLRRGQLQHRFGGRRPRRCQLVLANL